MHQPGRHGFPGCFHQSGKKDENGKTRQQPDAFYDPDTGRYFAEIMYTGREGREQYDYEITPEIFGLLGTFADDPDNERLIRTAEMTYSFENTMYGTLGPERTVWNEEADKARITAEAKQKTERRKKNRSRE